MPPPPTRTQKTGARAMLLVKLLVTVSVCVFLVWKADWHEILESFHGANLLGIIVVFVSMVLCVTISAYKWQLLLNIHGAPFAFRELHRYYFIAMFFNNFLPTSIGGDGYRIYKTWHNPRSRTSAVISVFIERITGILSLLILGWIGAIAGYFHHGGEISRIVMLLGFLGLTVSIPLGLLLKNPKFGSWLIGHRRLPAVIKVVWEHLDDYRRRPRQSLFVILVSVGFHIFTLGWMALLIASVGGAMAMADLIVVMALVGIAAIVPISINGIGVVDGSFIYLAGHFGLDYDLALTVMLAQRALLIPISLIGGLLYLGQRRSTGNESPQTIPGVTENQR